MPIRQRFDTLLLATAVVQVGVGLALMASASWVIASERYGRPGSYFFSWQAATALIGLGAMVVCMHLRSHLLVDVRVARAALVVSWGALGLAFLQPPIAATHRWLTVGGVSLQPSVIARLAVTMVAAVELAGARAEGWRPARLLRLAAVGVVTAGLVVAEPDLGSAALILLVLGAMAFVSGMPLRLLAAPVAVAGCALVLAVVSSPYRLARVRAFFDPSLSSAADWQSLQSLIAVGSGGLIGRGYGAGLQKLFFLPEPHTDFVFAIAGEELGLVGVLALVALAAVVTWRALRIAARLEGTRALLAFGLGFVFAAQSLVHMAVCLDLLPPKGIPLPLVSYGKTDLLVSLTSLGLLLNLSREAGS